MTFSVHDLEPGIFCIEPFDRGLKQMSPMPSLLNGPDSELSVFCRQIFL